MPLYFSETGPADAPAIVFLHGAGLSGRMWQPQVERLTELHCIVPDLPEQGRSLEIGPFTLEDAAWRVAEIIAEHARTGRAHLVGLSLGGAVALTLLRQVPMRVDHVIVSGTSTRLNRLLAAINALNVPFLRLLKPDQLARLMLCQFGIPEKYREMLKTDAALLTPAAFGHINQALTTLDVPREVASPVLVCVGERETVAAKVAARRLCHLIWGARGVVAPGVGHVWNLEAPDLFSDMVRAWVQDAPLPRPLIEYCHNEFASSTPNS